GRWDGNLPGGRFSAGKPCPTVLQCFTSPRTLVRGRHFPPGCGLPSLANEPSSPWRAVARRRASLTASEREVVASLGNAIARRIGEPRYNLWFARNTKFTWADDQLVVGVPNHFYQEWLQSTFADAVRSAAHEVLGRPMQLR